MKARNGELDMTNAAAETLEGEVIQNHAAYDRPATPRHAPGGTVRMAPEIFLGAPDVLQDLLDPPEGVDATPGDMTDFDESKSYTAFNFMPPNDTILGHRFRLEMRASNILYGLSVLQPLRVQDGVLVRAKNVDRFGRLGSLAVLRQPTGWMRFLNPPKAILAEMRIMPDDAEYVYARLVPPKLTEGILETVVQVKNAVLGVEGSFPLHRMERMESESDTLMPYFSPQRREDKKFLRACGLWSDPAMVVSEFLAPPTVEHDDRWVPKVTPLQPLRQPQRQIEGPENHKVHVLEHHRSRE